jgi:glycosyltransferase involved in cell wall biosynthesis
LDKGYVVHYLSTREIDTFGSSNKIVPHIVPVPYRKFSQFWSSLCFNFLLPFYALALCLRKKFSAVIIFWPYLVPLIWPATAIRRIPVFLFLRSIPWKQESFTNSFILFRPLRMLGYRLAISCSRKIFVTSNVLEQLITKQFHFAKNKIIVLTYSVILPEFLGESIQANGVKGALKEWLNNTKKDKRDFKRRYLLPDKSIVLATSGVLTEGKNIQVVIRAMAASENKNISLLVCGDGPEKKNLMSITVGLGLTDYVSFAGWIDQPIELIAACDLFILPSTDGVMSNSLFEALGAGVPVIASDVPHCREVLKYEELLFDPHHVERLAQKLNAIGNEKLLLNKLQKLSFSRAEELSFDWGAKAIEIIEGL